MKARLTIATLLVTSMASLGTLASDEASLGLLAQSSVNAASDEATRATDVAATESVTIGEGDTLWSLAARLRPSEDIAIQQMVLALVEANPEVFPGDDLNRMRAGQRLVVPSREMIEKRSTEEAKRQYQARSQPSRGNDRQQAPPASTVETVAEEPPVRLAPEDAEKPQETGPEVDASGAGELQAAPEASANDEKMAIETPQLVDRRLAALALEKEQQAIRDELQVLRNRNQAMRNQLAQQQQELIALQEQLSDANARARAAEREVEQGSTSWWQQLGGLGLALNAVILALVLGGVALYRRRQTAGTK